MEGYKVRENGIESIEGIVEGAVGTKTPIDNEPQLLFKLEGDKRHYAFTGVHARVDVGERVRVRPCSKLRIKRTYVDVIEILGAEGNVKFAYVDDETKVV